MNTFKKETWKYIRPEDGVIEEVERMDWEWQAEYMNGTILNQFDEFHRYHRTSEIDTEQLKVLRFKSRINDKTISIIWNHRKSGIYFIRHIALSGGKYTIKIHFFGYEELGTKYIVAVFPDGNTVILNDPDLLSVEFYD